MTKRRLVEHKPAAKEEAATTKARAKAPSRARRPKAKAAPTDALPARDYIDQAGLEQTGLASEHDDRDLETADRREDERSRDASPDDAAGDEMAFIEKGGAKGTRSKPQAVVQGRGKGAAASSSALGARAAVAMLNGKGSAVDSVLSAFFAEAGNDPSVLFSPVSALVFGGGAGARAFDGRLRQPGLGAARPRGVRDGDVVLEASRVAAPRSVATAILLHTFYGRASLSEVTRQGVSDAKTVGAALRSKLLQRIGAAGGAALSKSEILGAILAVAGTAVGGALTEEDILEAIPGGTSLVPSASFGEAKMYRVPWGSQVAQDKAAEGAPTTEVIAACDSWGLVALLSFERGRGLMVPELEVALPLSGIPVRRGVTRTSPGTVLPSPSPLVVIDRGPDLRVAFGARVTPEARVRVVTPADIEPIAVATPVDAGVREVARRMSATVAVVALEARGARAITASDAAA